MPKTREGKIFYDIIKYSSWKHKASEKLKERERIKKNHKMKQQARIIHSISFFLTVEESMATHSQNNEHSAALVDI